MRTLRSSSNKIDALEKDYLYKSVSQIPNSGNGLFTAINIFKDETIAIFKGEILSNSLAKLRAEKGNDRYFISMPNGNIMDSMHVRCFAKYANDAQGITNLNIKNNAQIALDDNDNICLRAIRHIKANEEVFCSYGKRYWKKHG